MFSFPPTPSESAALWEKPDTQTEQRNHKTSRRYLWTNSWLKGFESELDSIICTFAWKMKLYRVKMCVCGSQRAEILTFTWTNSSWSLIFSIWISLLRKKKTKKLLFHAVWSRKDVKVLKQRSCSFMNYSGLTHFPRARSKNSLCNLKKKCASQCLHFSFAVSFMGASKSCAGYALRMELLPKRWSEHAATSSV